MMKQIGFWSVLILGNAVAFSPQLSNVGNARIQGRIKRKMGSPSETTIYSSHDDHDLESKKQVRRTFLQRALLFPVVMVGQKAWAEPDFASIAQRAAMLSSEVEKAEKDEIVMTKPEDIKKTVYDFTVPVAGKPVSLEELVTRGRQARPKAILVVNIKQDDPIARRNIPELIALGAQFGQQGDLAVVCVPTDQGYFEPDTSALIRLKMASEYGYGINPALQLTDKVNLLGNTANSFMRYLQSTCRTPAGLGKIQGNFEKFLIDGQTGKPLRRYPRKYMPRDIAEDIDALVQGQPLPPAGSNFKERWREATVDAERDTYRFQKGLNYFDYDYYEK